MSIPAGVVWMTPEMHKALADELQSVTELQQNTRIMKTEEGREIVARMRRLLEILVHGRVVTPVPPRHHE